MRYAVLCCMAVAAWRWLQACAGVLHCKAAPLGPAKSFILSAAGPESATQQSAAYHTRRHSMAMRMHYTCLKDRTLKGACLAAVKGGCPLKGVKGVRKCKEQCDAAAGCTALVYNRRHYLVWVDVVGNVVGNVVGRRRACHTRTRTRSGYLLLATCYYLPLIRYGECYLHAGDDIGQPAAQADGASHKTVLCSKATYPAHAYVLHPRGVRGRASVATSTAALLRANFSGKVQGANSFELFEQEEVQQGVQGVQGGGHVRRFTRLALAELHRWPACKSRLATAAASGGSRTAAGHRCTLQQPSCCLQRWWDPAPALGPAAAPGAVDKAIDEARCCAEHSPPSPYLDGIGGAPPPLTGALPPPTGANATLRSAHACSAVPGRTLSFARLLLHLYTKHRKGGAEPPGLVPLLAAEP